MLSVLLLRELKLALRRPAELANPLVFFLLVVSLFPFAVSPEAADLAKIEKIVAEEADKKRALEDVFWALMNTREFMFNH